MEKTLYEKSIFVMGKAYSYRLFLWDKRIKLAVFAREDEAIASLLRLDLSGFSSERLISFLDTLCESQTHPREFLSLLEENMDFFYSVEENSWE